MFRNVWGVLWSLNHHFIANFPADFGSEKTLKIGRYVIRLLSCETWWVISDGWPAIQCRKWVKLMCIGASPPSSPSSMSSTPTDVDCKRHSSPPVTCSGKSISRLIISWSDYRVSVVVQHEDSDWANTSCWKLWIRCPVVRTSEHIQRIPAH